MVFPLFFFNILQTYFRKLKKSQNMFTSAMIAFVISRHYFVEVIGRLKAFPIKQLTGQNNTDHQPVSGDG